MPIDWDKLREISDRAEALSAAGHMTVAEFRKLKSDALAASEGDPSVLEGLALYAPPELLTA